MARRLPRWRTRLRRRVLVGLWMLSPLTLITMTVALEWGNPALPWVYMAVLASWYPFWLILRVLTTASAEAVAAILDEREVELRNRLSYVAFNVLLISNILIVFYLGSNGDDPLVAARATFLLTACMLLSASVPTALLAWRMPDDDPEDFDEPLPGPPTAGVDSKGEQSA